MGKLKTQLPELPTSTVILGVRFRIEYPVTISDKSSGETTAGDRLIKIATSMNVTPDEYERSLLHETIHAILGLSGQDQGILGDKEEGLVIALGNGLNQLYRRRM